MLSFNPSAVQQSSCFNVIIIQDNVVEERMENFLLQLLPIEQRNDISVDLTIHTVTILDADRERC